MARLGVWRWWSPRYSRTIRRAGDASDARRSLRSRRVYLCPEVERACVDVLAVWFGDPRAVDDVHGCASGHQTQCFQLVAEKRCWRVFRSRPASSERQPCAPDLPCLPFPDVGVAARYGVGVARTAREPTQRRRFPWLLRGGHVLQEATRFEAELLCHVHVGGRKPAASCCFRPFLIHSQFLLGH
jgi:hypothetical protein